MISRYNYRDFTWVDIESPTREELLHIGEEFSIAEHIVEDLCSHSIRPKVEHTKNALYLVLHFPATATNKTEHKSYELDFVIGKNFLVTTHYETIDPLYTFSKTFEVSTMLDKDARASHPGYVFSALMRTLYKDCVDELDSMTHELNKLERNIFSNKEYVNIQVIANLSKKILDFKQAVRNHHDILKSFESASEELFGDQYKDTAELLIAEYSKLHNALEQNKETLTELKDTHNALVGSKTQDIMKTLTIITVVMMPMTLLAAIFTIRLPEGVFLAKTLGDFYFIIGAMTLTAIVMLIFFKLKKWL